MNFIVRNGLYLLFSAALAPCLVQAARAAELVAIVEESEGDTGDVRLFDMLETDRVIELGSGGRLILGYLRSCWRETITGGVVTVGTEHSRVERGRVYRELVECDGGSLQLSAALSDKSGVMAYRAPPGEDSSAPAQVILFSLAPAFRTVGTDGKVTIERLDKGAPLLVLAVTKGTADMAGTTHRLAPGGFYRAESGEARVTFAIDSLAEDAGGSLIGRLVFLKP
jgi:hypothetical protein